MRICSINGSWTLDAGNNSWTSQVPAKVNDFHRWRNKTYGCEFQQYPVSPTGSGTHWYDTYLGTADSWSFGSKYDQTNFGNFAPRFWKLNLPMWVSELAFAVLPLKYAISLRTMRKRRSQGMCETCGYELRGLPERCPECGVALPAGPGT